MHHSSPDNYLKTLMDNGICGPLFRFRDEENTAGIETGDSSFYIGLVDHPGTTATTVPKDQHTCQAAFLP